MKDIGPISKHEIQLSFRYTLYTLSEDNFMQQFLCACILIDISHDIMHHIAAQNILDLEYLEFGIFRLGLLNPYCVRSQAGYEVGPSHSTAAQHTNLEQLSTGMCH